MSRPLARIKSLVSTTSRTVAFLLPLPANRVHLGLNFVVRQFARGAWRRYRVVSDEVDSCAVHAG